MVVGKDKEAELIEEPDSHNDALCMDLIFRWSIDAFLEILCFAHFFKEYAFLTW